VYCQAGKSGVLTGKRRVFVPTRDIMEEVKALPKIKIDYITFSGAGEPTLAKNLGEIIKEVKKIRKEKIAVLTNSTLIGEKDVRKDLESADFVIAKLDAHSEKLFKKINKPAKRVRLKSVIKGLKEFGSRFKGNFALQLMFTRGNKGYAGDIARVARGVAPDEVYINTPLRPSGIKPLPKNEIQEIKKYFKGMRVVTVYERKRKKR
jgi:wyosine [tRNA(Phe)-imidazoG37] synthetase (radical SAM superfamily)